MTMSQNAGAFRLMTSGTAALALLASAARAQGGVAAGSTQSARVMIVAKDTTSLKLFVIDSLAKRLNGLPVGSAEFVAANAALEAALKELPRPAGASSGYRFEITAPRAMVRATPMDV